ncbi:MAG TPA: hypothetical protein DCQ45_00900 [Erysipelotrichaceae bacterium]|nr:hypothetical protein [Erysipelotrichaceae bacterium]
MMTALLKGRFSVIWIGKKVTSTAKMRKASDFVFTRHFGKSVCAFTSVIFSAIIDNTWRKLC